MSLSAEEYNRIMEIYQDRRAANDLAFRRKVSALYEAHPEWGMMDRVLLKAIDYEKGTIALDGKNYELLDKCFPTIDPADPLRLTLEEQEVIDSLVHSFQISSKLQRHTSSLLSHGSMCSVFNGNLLFHARVPLNDDGTLRNVRVGG